MSRRTTQTSPHPATHPKSGDDKVNLYAPSAEVLQRALDLASNGVFVFDGEDGRLLQTNQEARRAFQLGGDGDSGGVSIDTLLPDLTGKAFGKLAEPLRRGTYASVYFTSRARRRDGTVFAVEGNLGVFSDEHHKEIFIAVTQDVTERNRILVESARSTHRLSAENADLREYACAGLSFAALPGKSAQWHEVLRTIENLSSENSPVLIRGETGTGREWIARSIHEFSPHREEPFFALRGSSLSRSHYSEEILHHLQCPSDRREALTAGGTLFLDSIDDSPAGLQAKLVQSIAEKRITIGNKTLPFHFRLIAATDRDLPAEIGFGRFNPDLNSLFDNTTLRIPPLRERGEDIIPLAQYFLERIGRRLSSRKPKLTANSLDLIRHHSWPGNEGELFTVIERALLVYRNGLHSLEEILADTIKGAPSAPVARPEKKSVLVPYPQIEQMEKESVEAALTRACGKLYGPGGAAEMLGIKPTTLAYRIKILGLKK